jgi:hypothetical protein
MIKNVTTLLTLLSITLFAQINFAPTQSKVDAIQDNMLVVSTGSNVQVGSSGVVMHAFDEKHKTIIASVQVAKKEGDKLYLKLLPFKYIPQDTLPSYKIKPQVGDEVVLNFLYNRALAIVPDADTYKTVTQSFEKFEWIHPDIFAAKLSKSYNPTPDKETFQEICIEQNIGLLLIYAKGEGHFIDCQSFQTLHQIPLPAPTSVKVPFYNRLDPIKGRVFGLFGGKGVKDYDSFYNKLLK